MDRSVLKSMTDGDLRSKAKALGVQRSDALKKDELIDAILAVGNHSKSDAADKADAAVAAKTADSTKFAGDTPAQDKKAGLDKSSLNDVKDIKDKTVSDADIKAGSADDDKKAAAVKSAAVADDPDDDAMNVSLLAEIARIISEIDADDTLDAEAKKAKKAALKEALTAKKSISDAKNAAAEAVEPPPVEPDSIFIDHGAILPQYVPGTCLFALVRDPGTLFVYWNASFESDEGWILTAYDAAGMVLQSFTTPARRNGRGYFRVPTARVACVTLVPANPQKAAEFRLESKIRIAQQLGIAQPRPRFDERWVDFQNHEVVYEAPAPGYAPAFQDVYQSMTAPAITGGGFDRSVEQQAGQNAINGSMSSRFGSLNAPGSSDTLVGSSDRIVRH